MAFLTSYGGQSLQQVNIYAQTHESNEKPEILRILLDALYGSLRFVFAGALGPVTYFRLPFADSPPMPVRASVSTFYHKPNCPEKGKTCVQVGIGPAAI